MLPSPGPPVRCPLPLCRNPSLVAAPCQPSSSLPSLPQPPSPQPCLMTDCCITCRCCLLDQHCHRHHLPALANLPTGVAEGGDKEKALVAIAAALWQHCRGVGGEASKQGNFVIVVVVFLMLFLHACLTATKKSTNGNRHCTYYYLKVRAVMIADYLICYPAPLDRDWKCAIFGGGGEIL